MCQDYLGSSTHEVSCLYVLITIIRYVDVFISDEIIVFGALDDRSDENPLCTPASTVIPNVLSFKRMSEAPQNIMIK